MDPPAERWPAYVERPCTLVPVEEIEILVAGRSVMVRVAGDEDGFPVVHCHGTPGSRLEVSFGDEIAHQQSIRIISFDRPGYGQSDPASSSLGLVAQDVESIVDALRVGQFATLGWSGGGPFALAVAAAMSDRVTHVGVSGGLAPVQQMPGAREELSENDLRALAYLPDEPDRAAAQFLEDNKVFLDTMMSARNDPTAPWIDWQWGESDADAITDQQVRDALFVSFHEALRQSPAAIAWDNVAFIGPWGFDFADVASPVHLWYGDRDLMAPSSNGTWLAQHLPNAELVVFEGEGHLLPLRHWAEMLRAVTTIR